MSHRANFELREQIPHSDEFRTIFRAYVHDGIPSSLGVKLHRIFESWQKQCANKKGRESKFYQDPSLFANFLIFEAYSMWKSKPRESEPHPLFTFRHPDHPMSTDIELFYVVYVDPENSEWTVEVDTLVHNLYSTTWHLLGEFSELAYDLESLNE
jgi:hypothetical protein